MKKTWWKEGTVYQIYPRSFKDENGDGVGDLKGIIQKLDYLQDLGIDILWLCPVYESPNDDNGYDVSNYRAISSDFGTMEDCEQLIEGLHQRGIRLIMDLVVNHSSDEHEWFKESRKSIDNPYRDYYIWRKGKNGGPPNNWVAFFGGSAWEYDEQTDEYYLHLFSKKQPDLNWENENLRKEIFQMMEFWLEKGVDGFRMDVIPFISKYQDFPDIDLSDFFRSVSTVYANGPRIHEFLQDMNREVLSRYDVMTVGEATGVNPEQGLLYVGEDRNELNMIFHFGHMFMHSGPEGRFDTVEPDFIQFKKVFRIWDEAMEDKGWNSIFLGNHDFARSLSRFGNDGKYRVESAKVLATLILTLRGTPYIYQGDEIGMKNLDFRDKGELRDIEALNYFNTSLNNGCRKEEIFKAINIHSRDHARSPMQWDDSSYAGFSNTRPWIKVNDDFEVINVKNQLGEEGSILSFYQKLIRFRKEHPVLIYGNCKFLEEEHPCLFIFERVYEKEKFMILLNFSDQFQILPIDTGPWELVLGNYDTIKAGNLQPWEARVMRANEGN